MIIFAYFNSLDQKKHLSRTERIKKYVNFEKFYMRSIYEAIEICPSPFFHRV
jgi:hypothetical protein